MSSKKVRKRKTAAKKKSPSSEMSLSLGRNVWPAERDVLFRPDRLKYVRKLLKPEGCVFCRAGAEAPSFDTLCVHQTEHSMIVLNKFPYNSGHLLILPRRHVGDLLSLSREEYSDLSELTREAMRALQDLYQPGGMNVGLNHGATAGAGIPAHLHYHLIPRGI